MMIALDPKDWLIDLAAVDLIVAADLNNLGSLIVYLAYILVAQLLLLALLLLTLLRADLAQEVLDRLSRWLDRNEQRLSVGVSFLFGLFLLVAGIQTMFLG